MELAKVQDPQIQAQINALVEKDQEKQRWFAKSYEQRFREFCEEESSMIGKRSWYSGHSRFLEFFGIYEWFHYKDDLPVVMAGSIEAMSRTDPKYWIYKKIVTRYLKRIKWTCVTRKDYIEFLENDFYPIVRRIENKFGPYHGYNVEDRIAPRIEIEDDYALVWINGKKFSIKGNQRIKMVQQLWNKSKKLNKVHIP